MLSFAAWSAKRLRVVAGWIQIAPEKPAVGAAFPFGQLTHAACGTLMQQIAIDGLEPQIVAGDFGQFADISGRLTAIGE